MTRLPLWTGGKLGLPVEMEMSHVKSLACFGLPAGV